MPTVNEVRLLGNLTRDPQLRKTPNGQDVCDFGIAMNRKFKGQDGTQREETTFVDVTCWSHTATNCAKYLHKGSLVYVGGRLKLDTWEDKQTGARRQKLTVVAENVQFLDSRRQEQQGQAQQGAAAYVNKGSQQAGEWSPGEPGY